MTIKGYDEMSPDQKMAFKAGQRCFDEIVPSAPEYMELPARIQWRAGYRQAVRDLLQIDLRGGELAINGKVVLKVEREVGKHESAI